MREKDSSEEEVSPNYDLLNKASEEFYANDGKVSAETLEELGKLDISMNLISAYIPDARTADGKVNDLTDAASVRDQGPLPVVMRAIHPAHTVGSRLS